MATQIYNLNCFRLRLYKLDFFLSAFVVPSRCTPPNVKRDFPRNGVQAGYSCDREAGHP
jgi:hypothetical protein